MKLTKYQKARLLEYNWDVITNKVDGKEQNCGWISIAPEDGSIFSEVVKHFGLTGEGEDVKLLVVATTEKD
jgi:hypothetical protein